MFHRAFTLPLHPGSPRLCAATPMTSTGGAHINYSNGVPVGFEATFQALEKPLVFIRMI